MIRRNVYFPTYSNSLKEIGKFLGCSWNNPDSSGLQSIVWRFQWEKSKDESFKNRLITYNQEDCIALKSLVNFLININDKRQDNTDSQLQRGVFYVRGNYLLF